MPDIAAHRRGTLLCIVARRGGRPAVLKRTENIQGGWDLQPPFSFKITAMQPTVPDTPPPPATEIRPLREAEIRRLPRSSAAFSQRFEAPDYAQEGIDVFHRFIAPEALTEQFRTGALKLWGAFRQDTLAGVARSETVATSACSSWTHPLSPAGHRPRLVQRR